MKNIIAILILFTFIGCSRNFEMYEGDAELVKYYATPDVTEFSYKVNEQDTCQMALEKNIIFASYKTIEGGIIVNIKVQHAK